jgi:hypothetical protein
VFGLDDRPQARPHFRNRLQGNVHWRATSNSFTPTQLASLYNFAAGTGQGQCIGIIELGGGYRPTDLKTYFSGLGVALPKVSTVVKLLHSLVQGVGCAVPQQDGNFEPLGWIGLAKRLRTFERSTLAPLQDMFCHRCSLPCFWQDSVSCLQLTGSNYNAID